MSLRVFIEHNRSRRVKARAVEVRVHYEDCSFELISFFDVRKHRADVQRVIDAAGPGPLASSDSSRALNQDQKFFYFLVKVPA